MPTAAFPTISIKVEREQMEVTSFTSIDVPDEKWRYVDKAGHGHFWKDGELPTLKWVITGKGWVGDEYDGSEYDIGEYRCKLCEETIKPKKRSEAAKPILGPTTVTLEVAGERFVLTEGQYAESVKAWVKALKTIAGRWP